MKLYLIAGHGAGDSGATGNGYQEAERVRALCGEIKRIGGNNVVYLDPNRNWYADGGINSLNIPDSDCLLECHMDAASPSARGGHVIIYSGFAPDEYDKALASLMADMFAGRSQTIVKRDDLANPNRAAKRGINYRLVEFGFITNKDDVNKFNTRLTELATRVLKCFGINGSTVAAPAQPVTKPVTKLDYASKFDKALAKEYICTDALNLRIGAGTNKQIIITMAKGTKVNCYGYYTPVNNTKWLYVNAVIKGVTYTGFCSADYLK